MKNSRRAFLNKLLTTKPASKQLTLLTSDGELVEVDQSIIDQIKKGQKASNEEIVAWSNKIKQ